MVEYIVEKIKKADLVLVGLGEEADMLTDLKKNLHYQNLAQKLDKAWILPFVNKMKIDEESAKEWNFTIYYRKVFKKRIILLYRSAWMEEFINLGLSKSV